MIGTTVEEVAPSRGRGLKPILGALFGVDDEVAPSRGRGLKRGLHVALVLKHCRPFTGAWIETQSLLFCSHVDIVAPSRGRGLKPPSVMIARWSGGRPFTGAWIETAASQ